MAKQKTEEPVQRLTFDIPESTHKQLKVLAAETGKPMRILILEWIQNGLSKASDRKAK